MSSQFPNHKKKKKTVSVADNMVIYNQILIVDIPFIFLALWLYLSFGRCTERDFIPAFKGVEPALRKLEICESAGELIRKSFRFFTKPSRIDGAGLALPAKVEEFLIQDLLEFRMKSFAAATDSLGMLL